MKAGILGLGRFGYLWAELLSSCISTGAYDARASIRVPSTVKKLSLADFSLCPFVFLCVPISAIEQALKSLTPHLAADATVIDTCSVKEYPVSQMDCHLTSTQTVIGSHPLFGPDSFNPDGGSRPVALCFVRGDRKKYTDIKNLYQQLGCEIHEMSASEHDKLMAHTQGITHIMGRILHHLPLPDHPATPWGYQLMRKVVRQTCQDSLQLFHDLQHYNAYTSDIRTRLMESFHDVIGSFDSKIN